VVPRAQALVRTLGLVPHPEGGHYGEVFRSAVPVPTGRGQRSALTTIDFLLAKGEFSAWHRVRSDEVWHLLEGGPLRLWLIPADLSRIEHVDLGLAGQQHPPRRLLPGPVDVDPQEARVRDGALVATRLYARGDADERLLAWAARGA
jgi:predicted cupin superfamily sugar epimerase